MNWTVKHRIILGFSSVIASMVVLTIFAFVRIHNIDTQATNLLVDSLPGVFVITRIESIVKDEHLRIQKHVLSDSGSEMSQYEAEIASFKGNIDKLMEQYQATITTAEDRRLFDILTNTQASYIDSFQALIRLSRVAAAKEAQLTLRDKLDPAYQKYLNAIRSFVVLNEQSGEQAARNIQIGASSAQTAILAGLMGGFVFSVLCGYLLIQAINRPLDKVVGAMEVMRNGDFSKRLALSRRDEFGILAQGFDRMTDDLTALIGQVQRSGIQVNTSLTEIAATSRQQQATATEIAATTSEIGATSKEISATSKELVATMSEVARLSEEAATLTGSSHDELARMADTMRQITEAAGSVNAKLSVVNEKAGNISQVVTTITKVADQTNLLSLNAAIEAEKAGDAGRGFAVVASEIRRLSDQTGVATYDIEQMVKEMQSAVSAGVMGMDKFSEEVRKGVAEVHQVSTQLSQIIQQVQALTPRFETVNDGMQSQATGAQQISDALMQLSESAQQTVDSLKQSNVAIEQLNEAVRGLQSGVSRFRLQA